MAKVISRTLLAITAILSCLVLISIYIQANSRCSCGNQVIQYDLLDCKKYDNNLGEIEK